MNANKPIIYRLLTNGEQVQPTDFFFNRRTLEWESCQQAKRHGYGFHESCLVPHRRVLEPQCAEPTPAQRPYPALAADIGEQRPTKIGFSLSFCVCDICEGKVKVEDVLFIQTGCNPSCAADVAWLLESYAKTYWRKYPVMAGTVFDQLRRERKIVWVSSFEKHPPTIAWGHWLTIPTNDGKVPAAPTEPYYRLLKEGEVCLATDEYYDDTTAGGDPNCGGAGWISCAKHHGELITASHTPHRRRVELTTEQARRHFPTLIKA